MSDQQQDATKPAEKASVLLKTDVKQLLSDSGPTIRSRIVKHMADQELDKREKAVLAVVAQIEEKQKELRKLEGQGEVRFNHESKPVGEPTFTKQQLDEIKKCREEIDKRNAALEKAFLTSDFQKVIELGNQKSGQQQGQ